MSTTPDPDRGDAEDPSNVLVLAPRIGDHEDRACGRLLDDAVVEDTHAIMVACGGPAEERLTVWEDQTGTKPVEATLVDVEAVTRSAAPADGGDAPAADLSNVRHRSVSDPTALIELGTTLDTCLHEPTPAEHTVLCFHALTDALQYSERREVFKFLEVLTGNVDRAGAVAHYHMDPTAHDGATVEMFERLCDVTVDTRDTEPSPY